MASDAEVPNRGAGALRRPAERALRSLTGGALPPLIVAASLLMAVFGTLAATFGAADEASVLDELDVDYQTFVNDYRVVYEQSLQESDDAAQAFFNDDGSGYVTGNAPQAMALYRQSITRIEELQARYAPLHQRIPLLFVQMEHVLVKDLSGMAAVLTATANRRSARELRERVVVVAAENRKRIALAFENRTFPDLHDIYRELDEQFAFALAESHVWLGMDAAERGDLDTARVHYHTALELAKDDTERTAIQALVESLP